jgi:hypothetical protein
MQTASTNTVHSRTVRILNPITGGGRFTNRQSAKRYIKRGHAEWANSERTAIRFCSVSKTRAVESEVNSRRREQEVGYDRIARSMSVEEMANIPIIAPWKLLRGAREQAIQ